ncbi:protein ecdysoneless [Harpegnathos saltator]|uniref:SGT1 protein-like protein ecdysoneless n=1 Tax=Harpegnathos saltator TaxID=610380 RepID=E2C868_HARSA|nr:protein ecdysoneless [Harpegnathos saltator]EFN75871.1 SGT1 protein-like protein ecdysoneless [Harpegnathos saltator]
MANTTVMHKAKEEDILECFLYPKFCYTTDPDAVTEATLIEEIAKYNAEIAPLIVDHIWHCDSLNFRPRIKQAMLLNRILEGSAVEEDYHTLPHIYASLRFDEDIGDEWLTVFLIFRLTKVFNGLIARVVDSDGEFLLIEAANVLPLWASPETCQDRVFIHNGDIHVIRERGTSFPNLLNNINGKPYISKMSEKVQLVLQKRIGIYPDEIQKRKHKTRAFLPEKAASILRLEPRLIAPAIRTICHSDPLERRVCRAMRYFPPEQRTMVNLKMTKCLYAMATYCRYTGDPRTGWNIPPATCSKYNAHVLGVKVACGLEMLVARANEERRKCTKEKSDVSDDTEKLKLNEPAFNAYLARLEASGYFRDLLEGSQERDKLLSTAKEYFLKHATLFDNLTNLHESDAQKVLEAWENIQTNDIEMHAQDETTLSPADSDSWLNIDPAQLETYLNQQWGNIKDKKLDQESLSLREKVQSFLNQTSTVDGVHFLGEQSVENDVMQDAEDSTRIEFDADAFDSALRGILDLVVPGGEGEFEGSSEGSLGGDDEDKGGDMDKYMRLLDSQVQSQLIKEENTVTAEDNNVADPVEASLQESIEAEAGGSGPAGNIIGGPVRRLMHLQLQSPTTVPPDLQS